MKRRTIRLALLAGALAVAVAASTAGAAVNEPKARSANNLTVWLQVDARSGWPEVVASATQQFKQAHPGWDVNVQYQNWGDHLQKFDATLAANTAPDVIEMGNTEMTKYMAAGAFADLTSKKSSFDNSSSWLKGLAASAVFGGKTYGVPYYAGSRVVTYRTDLFKQAGIKRLPTSLAEYTLDARKLAKKNSAKSFSPVYIAGTDWYVAMSFVYDFGGQIATRYRGNWVGTLDRPAALKGLAAYKAFFQAASRASKTAIETRPNPYDVYAQGNAASMIGPGWFSCCVGDHKTATAQFVMPGHVKGQPMPGFLGGSDLAVPGHELEQERGGRLDQGVHRHDVDEGAPGEGQHPERDQPARQERERARSRAELVRADREALGRRRERKHPAQHAGPDPHGASRRSSRPRARRATTSRSS